MKTIQYWIETNKIEITQETLLVHNHCCNNTIEARATCHLRTPDGEIYEGERIIKIKMKRLKE